MPRPQKVIRTKRIYRKRRTNKKLLGQIAFVLILLLLIGLGYIIMKEWSVRFGKDASSNQSSIINNDNIQSGSDIDIPNNDDLDDESKEAAFTNAKTISYLDVCGKSKEQLITLFTSIKDEGYDSFYVLLKTEDGMVHFKSNTQYATQYNLVASDAVDLNIMVSAASEVGIEPIAALSTLKDPTAHIEKDNSYRFLNTEYNWLDAAYDSGGKPWLNPYKQNTKNYISSLAGELYQNGIKIISLENVNYPTQNTEQMNTDATSPSKMKALFELIEAVKVKTGDALVINTVDMAEQVRVSSNAFLADLKETGYEYTALKIDLSVIEQNREILAQKVFNGSNNSASAKDIAAQMIKSVAEDETIGKTTVVILNRADYEVLKSVLTQNDIKSYVLS